MRAAINAGLSFGLTSGVITTLGLMVGLAAGTQSRLAVIGGVLTVAIADACSDALGMHVSEESHRASTVGDIWAATFATLITKALVAATFLVPVIWLKLSTALWVSVVWGLLLVGVLSGWMAVRTGRNPVTAILEHISITGAVVLISYYAGVWTAATFGS